MIAAEVDSCEREFDRWGFSEWDCLPPLDEAALPDEPPVELVLVEWPEYVEAPLVFADPADAATDPAEALQQGLAWQRPGLAESARLAALDFSALTAAERIDALAGQQRQQSWWAARQLSLLSLISAGDSSSKHWCVEEVGCALGLSGPAAQNLLKNAERLCRQLPTTVAALSEGRIGPAHATAIAEASYALPDQVLPDYEARVLRSAPQQSTVQLKRTAKRAALQLDPASAEHRHQRSVADRHIRIAPADHGTSWLMALLPAAQAQLLYDRVDAAARLAPADDDRTMDQLRADALVNGVLNGIDGDLPTVQGLRPSISVTVPLSALAGRNDEPGWLDGYGPISAGYARQLAHDPTGTWRRLVTDPVSGQLLDYGTTRYRPPQHLGDHVIARDGECTFPFCTRQARRSDLDHIAAYPAGSTSAGNLHPLHRRHHNAKTVAGWRISRDADTGSSRWISPAGRHYRTDPPERWPAPMLPSDQRSSPTKPARAHPPADQPMPASAGGATRAHPRAEQPKPSAQYGSARAHPPSRSTNAELATRFGSSAPTSRSADAEPTTQFGPSAPADQPSSPPSSAELMLPPF